MALCRINTFTSSVTKIQDLSDFRQKKMDMSLSYCSNNRSTINLSTRYVKLKLSGMSPENIFYFFRNSANKHKREKTERGKTDVIIQLWHHKELRGKTIFSSDFKGVRGRDCLLAGQGGQKCPSIRNRRFSLARGQASTTIMSLHFDHSVESNRQSHEFKY